ncbi:unnamed protein product [Clavelina lepadiformis]|uniref:Uncharacterized protein n=1 Tax=Clavelina lepadiformis TaxID=159417 RepID=A0ABP0GS91_CLALP
MVFRSIFVMLKRGFDVIGGNGESMISWDHFFTSCHRYYDNLRQDLPSPHETTSPFPTQPFSSQTSQRTCTITPHEVEGLRAVMQLVAKVAQYDDIACVAFYEDTHWSVCGILFGLMQCPVPIRLKGEIMAALSHMARIPDIALGLLQACETSQLLQSLPALGKPLGITAELAEVESREEQYPMTQGFIKLLSALSNLQGLGGGFTRYLLFVVESVFLPLLSRAYSRSEEKWEVASASLEFFNRLLSNYHPLPEHFQEKATTLHESSSSVVASSRKLPAFAFLQHIYHEGNFFKIVMQIIEQCITYLDTYITKHDLERTLVESAERALQLILNALELQEVFVSALRTSGSSLLITTLDKLLFGINPQTKRADYTINIARLITHNGSHPNLSLLAVQVISWLSFSMSHNQLVTVMMNSCNVATRHKITQGFVEVLDSACFESREADTEEPVISQCRLSIVRILVHSVDLPSPNMSQLLLFDAATNPSQANLQDPGVMGASRSCLHSVLSILSGQSTQPAAIVETPKLAEVCYQLIYRLAYNTETSEPVLRYLRSSHDFIYKHLQYLPFNTDDQVPTNTLMMQQSWLLKTAAIELHSLATKQQRTNAQRLLQVLFSQVKANTSITVNQSMNQSHLTTMMDTTSHSVSFLDTTSVQSSSALTVVRMLDIVDFSQAFPSPLNLDQFIPSVVEEGIKSCESTNEHGVVFCDVKMLHRMLETNLNTLGAEEMNRKRLAVQDMQNILQNVVVKNQMRDTLHAKLHLLTAWKHALEVALTSCPDDLLPRHTRQQVLFNIAQYLLKVTCNSEAAQELISPLAAVMLTLVIQIRSSLMESVDVDRSSISSQDQLLNVASTLATLQIVIKGILDWLLQSGINQKVRVHLYASLLHYLQLCQQNKKQSTGRGNHMTLRAAREDTYTRLNRENVKLLKDYGESFMDLICKDACSGQSICRVLAYGCLDCIVQMDVEQSWLQFMIKNGYINHIANSFLQEDEALQEYLLPNSGPSRAVYIYEQKMALLCSIVHSLGGARAIIDSGVLTQLASCSFLEVRPSPDYADIDALSPNRLSRYRQLLYPVLHLCSALLTALGAPSHHEVCALVLQFLLSHVTPIVTNVLKANDYDHESLTELKLVTEILCQTTGQDFSDVNLYPNIPQVVLMEIEGHLLRIQRQFLSLLPHYFVSDDFLMNIKSKLVTPEMFEKVNLLIHEVACNILTYCRVITIRTTGADSTVLFSPTLAESSDDVLMFADYGKPTMGILVQILRTVLTRFEKEKEKMSQLKYKLENVDNLSSQELKEFMDANTDVVQLSLSQEQKLVATTLKKSMQAKGKVLQCEQYILETALLLLWQHLDHYVTNAASTGSLNENILFPTKNQSRFEARRLQDISNVVYDDQQITTKTIARPRDIEQLKTELPTCMTDSFLKKLAEIEMKGSFVRPLVRRMQCVKLRLSKQ